MKKYVPIFYNYNRHNPAHLSWAYCKLSLTSINAQGIINWLIFKMPMDLANVYFQMQQSKVLYQFQH